MKKSATSGIEQYQLLSVKKDPLNNVVSSFLMYCAFLFSFQVEDFESFTLKM